MFIHERRSHESQYVRISGWSNTDRLNKHLSDSNIYELEINPINRCSAYLNMITVSNIGFAY